MVDISKFKDLYISETEDQLQILSGNLLVLEKMVNKGTTHEEQKDLLNDLMRASHTIKGSSATMNFSGMAYLAHVMEDVFDAARNDIFEINADMVDISLRAVDNLEKSLTSIKDSDKEIDLKNLAEEIKKMTGVNTVGTGKSEKNYNNIKNSNEKEGKNESVSESKKVDVKNKDKKEKSENLKTEPKVVKNEVQEEINEVHDSIHKINYIKVPIERLDTLMDLVEEIVIERMALRQLSAGNKKLQEVTDHINLLTQSLQYEVMQARLVPVDQVFARFPRMVRDLSKKQGKNVDFQVTGSDLELDRSIVDKLGEPLVHLLRNAVDHGIEKAGYVKLEAKRDRENAVIIVENDDQSISVEKVKRAALERGISTAKELENYNDEQIINLIFHPRLSTNKEVTEVSGRGVGLSVVKNFAESSGGRVIVQNLNPGVRFTMELPLTLAIVNSLLVEIGGNIYAIPFSNIDRSVIIDSKNIKKMADNHVGIVDGQKVPLLDLRKIFKAKENHVLMTENNPIVGIKKEPHETRELSEDLIVVIIKKDEELIGLVVDKLASEQEVTVKPLSSILRNIKGFSGSTILGDGRTILILDVINLLQTTQKEETARKN